MKKQEEGRQAGVLRGSGLLLYFFLRLGQMSYIRGRLCSVEFPLDNSSDRAGNHPPPLLQRKPSPALLFYTYCAQCLSFGAPALCFALRRVGRRGVLLWLGPGLLSDLSHTHPRPFSYPPLCALLQPYPTPQDVAYSLNREGVRGPFVASWEGFYAAGGIWASENAISRQLVHKRAVCGFLPVQRGHRGDEAGLRSFVLQSAALGTSSLTWPRRWAVQHRYDSLGSGEMPLRLQALELLDYLLRCLALFGDGDQLFGSSWIFSLLYIPSQLLRLIGMHNSSSNESLLLL